MVDATHVVLYTDGGYKSSTQIGGWGVHGYAFDRTLPKVGTGLKDWHITPQGYVTADKALGGKEKFKIFGDFKEHAESPKINDVNVLEYIDGRGYILTDATNNVAELAAFKAALSHCQHYSLLERLVILTDSQYVQNGFLEWAEKWEKQGWEKQTGEPVANKAYWVALLELKKIYQDRNVSVDVIWVKGHAGKTEEFKEDILGNRIADQYATQSMMAGANEHALADNFDYSDPRGYWKPKTDINRMLAHTRWYFDTVNTRRDMSSDGRYIYHIGDHGKDDDFLGKRMSDASFAVVYLKEPEPALETLRDRQVALDKLQNNSIMMGRLDYIFKPLVYQELVAHDCGFLEQRGHKLDLYTHDKLALTKELRPPRLAFNLVEVMRTMEQLLNYVMTDQVPQNVKITDISDLIYESEKKKNKVVTKIRSDLTVAVKSIAATVEHAIKGSPSPTEVTLTVGMDLPHRNALAALASANPTVRVVTWLEGAQAFRYATVVEAGDDIGFFAGFYSNIYITKTPSKGHEQKTE